MPSYTVLGLGYGSGIAFHNYISIFVSFDVPTVYASPDSVCLTVEAVNVFCWYLDDEAVLTVAIVTRKAKSYIEKYKPKRWKKAEETDF